MRRTIVSLLVSGGIVFGAALAEAPLALGQQHPQASPGQVPVVRIAVIDRTTQAINYRPRQGETEIDFAATALLPAAHGKATVSGEKGYMRIDARFERLQPPRSFGREYLTYVLWAITPEGRATNLGEVQYDDADARVKVTTELQAFGLIVTAEPYFAVTQPSDVVVLENAVRDGTRGKVETIQARYELLRRGTYLMDRDPEALQVKALEPGAPLDLAQARNAVELARLAGADQYAQDSFAKAVRLLADAETARQRGRKGNEVMMPARQAAQTAEDARLVAVRQQQEAVLAEERAQSLQRERASLDRERDALDRARIEEGRRLQAEQDARAEQERRRQAQLDAEASRLQAEREAQAEQERRRQTEVAAQTAALDKAAAERERVDALAAREAADEARRDAESARAAAQTQAQRAEAAVAQAEREKSELRAKVQEQLNVILETRETARGLVVNVSDVLFDTGSATLKPGAREKLARVAGVLLAHPGLNVAIEGHTDSVGTESSNQRLSEQRAQSVHDYLVAQGIPQKAVGTSGFGESQPVASNDTAPGRQQNRRVELVVTGESIGR
jgi:outer membrane protein OmpA-like peptidoglycan-associated protein